VSRAVEQSVVQDATKCEAPVVVVTGASRGIGKATALALGKARCKVISLSYVLLHLQKFSQMYMVLVLNFVDLD
jgi:NADP-dependent 3-hydroxy acid dehydrogenase YdfG